jgi:hypothetical protein
MKKLIKSIISFIKGLFTKKKQIIDTPKYANIFKTKFQPNYGVCMKCHANGICRRTAVNYSFCLPCGKENQC